MPVYEYLCPNCNKRFEARNSMNNRCYAVCPECNCIGNKQMSVFNFAFGWDRTWNMDGKGDRLVRNI